MRCHVSQSEGFELGWAKAAATVGKYLVTLKASPVEGR